MLELWLPALPLTLALMTAVWLVSLVRRDVSVVDVLWGPAFGVVAVLYYVQAPATGLRSALLLAGVLLWALRLGAHLGIRWLRKGEEDYRYAAMRREHGVRFPARSLVTVFWLQGTLVWVLSLPLLVGIGAPGAPGIVGWAGVLVFLVGFLWEAVADAQLTRFKADPANRGKVLQTGLWRYSRHPNYFGEALLWWGFFLVALDAGGGWTVFAPAVTTLLLMKVSGVPLLEPHLEETRPGYREYAARTPAFLPRLPGTSRGTDPL